MDKHRECIDQGHCSPRHQSKKDCAAWCKGRVGVEHDWEWMPIIDADDGRHYGTFLDGRVRYRDRDDAHGFSKEQQRCAGCGRTGAVRRRCHCGELLTPLDNGSRWRFNRFEPHCASCGYTIGWPQRWAGRGAIESWIDEPGRPNHACESAPKMARWPTRMKQDNDDV